MSKSSFSIFPVLKGLIAFNYKEALLRRLDICSSNLNWLSTAIPHSFTDLVVSIILGGVPDHFSTIFI